MNNDTANELNEGKILEERKDFIFCNSKNKSKTIKCESDSVAGAVSQRACVYCGARVVSVNPITDAFHIVHGPIGCASYTWDIRGSLSSGEEVYRNSFSTDVGENEIIFGGEKRLEGAISEIVEKFTPKLIFVYSTCIVGVIGDDVEAVCRAAQNKYGVPVIPVKSTGFAGNKSMGYRAACNALLKLMDMGDRGLFNDTLKFDVNKSDNAINFLGDFNLAGEMWIIKNYLSQMGIKLVAKITGDSTAHEIMRAGRGKLNIVQCAGSMIYLAKEMEKKYGIPYINVSFFGLEDTAESLFRVAKAVGGEEVLERARELVFCETIRVSSKINNIKKNLIGKKAAIYVGGGFKAISLIKQFNSLGIKTVMVGTQTGRAEEYKVLKEITDEGTIILDDTNPYELEKFIKEKGADILVGGVKERPLAYKLGIAFCDHNHERKHPLCGFEGAVNFAEEIDITINSQVWKFIS